MNAQFARRRWDVAPRGHPNDGRVDVVRVAATDVAARPVEGAAAAAARAPTCPTRASTTAGRRRPSSSPPPTSRTDGRPWLDGRLDRAARPTSTVTRASLTRWPIVRRAATWPCSAVGGHARMDPRRVARQLPLGGDRPARRSAPTTCASASVASALNHMDLWVTTGMPKPPLPHVPGLRRRRRRRGRRRGRHARGRRRRGRGQPGGVAARRRSSPSATTARWATGFMIFGEHRWGGHADVRRRARPQRACPSRPAAPGRSAPPTRWPTSPPTGCCAGPGCAPGETVLVVGIGGGVSMRRAGAGPAHGRRRVRHLPRARPSGRRRWPWAPRPPYDSRRREVAGAGRRRGRERRARPPGSSRSRALKPGGRLVVCGGTSGPEGRAQPAPAVLQAARDHRLDDGQLRGVRRGHRSSSTQGLPVARRRTCPARPSTRRRSSAWQQGEQLGKIVLRHDRT